MLVPEVLDVDNKWECGGCSAKVQASKFQEYSALPERLVLHLKRFRFDAVSCRNVFYRILARYTVTTLVRTCAILYSCETLTCLIVLIAIDGVAYR
jgi:ubiquitin C-terminal hydrolase